DLLGTTVVTDPHGGSILWCRAYRSVRSDSRHHHAESGPPAESCHSYPPPRIAKQHPLAMLLRLRRPMLSARVSQSPSAMVSSPHGQSLRCTATAVAAPQYSADGWYGTCIAEPVPRACCC